MRRRLGAPARRTAVLPRRSAGAPPLPQYYHPRARLSFEYDPEHPLAHLRRRLVIERRVPSGGASGVGRGGSQPSFRAELCEVEARIAELSARRLELLDLLAGTRWEVSIRPLGPDDQDRQSDFLSRMHQEDHWLRFFSQKRRYSSQEVRRLVDVNYSTDFALAAVDVGTDQLLGVARYYMIGDGAVEMAIALEGQMKGTGLASVLLDQLCLACRERGIRTAVATFLVENRPAIKLFDRVLAKYASKVSSEISEGTLDVTWEFSVEDSGRAAE